MTQPGFPSRILIIRPSALGDVCRTVPVLVSLRRAWPDARIGWLVRDDAAPAVEHHPDLNDVVIFPRRSLSRDLARLRPRSTLAFLRRLAGAKYDLVIDCQGLARSGFFAWCTRAPRRIGHAEARELGWLGLTERVRTSDVAHTVDRMLALVSHLGVPIIRDMRLYTPPEESGRFAREAKLADSRYAVLAPTSIWPGKRWPPERYAVVARGLLTRGFDAVVLTGTASERQQIEPLLRLAGQEPRVIDRVGSTTVGGLMALIEAASLVIANDSAAVHIAVGFDRPIIALFGPTRTDRVGPYRRDECVIQHVRSGERLDHKNEKAGRELMQRITADEVLDRIDGLAPPAS